MTWDTSRFDGLDLAREQDEDARALMMFRARAEIAHQRAELEEPITDPGWRTVEEALLERLAGLAGAVDLDSADGRFIMHILGVIARYEYETRDQPIRGIVTPEQRARLHRLLKSLEWSRTEGSN